MPGEVEHDPNMFLWLEIGKSRADLSCPCHDGAEVVDCDVEVCLQLLPAGPRQRFEADEFGRDEHSSASAGVILNGVGSLPTVGPTTRRMSVRRAGRSPKCSSGFHGSGARMSARPHGSRPR